MKLATPHLTGHEAVALVLDRVTSATEAELPGLVAALESVLSCDELPAAAVVAQVRREAEAERRTRLHGCLTTACELAVDLDGLIEEIGELGCEGFDLQRHKVRCLASDLAEVAEAMELELQA